MTNPFSAHGIDHLSPSSLNLWAASPAIFVLERLLKKRSAVGPAAHRGTAVEAGIVHGLTTGADANESAAKASAEFARLTALMTGDKVDREARAVPQMTRLGYAELTPYGKPTAMQGRVERRVDGLSVPIMGFFDLCWEQYGILLDIKTTHALPSKVSTSHARQVALYNAGLGGNNDVRITYVTPKKVATYSVENIEDHLLALERIAKALQKFLSISADPHELAGLIAPDVDSFYAAEPSTRQSIFEVWGI